MTGEESYTVWIMVEDDDGIGGEGRTYWAVDHFSSKDEAIEHAEEMAAAEYDRTGVEPYRLEEHEVRP